MTTVQYVAATALSLFVFVMMANFVVFLYARGAVRAAVDEGARAGGPIDATTSECLARARDVLDDLLGGAMRDAVQVSCRDDGGLVSAHADVSFASWLPGIVPDWDFALEGSSAKEREP